MGKIQRRNKQGSSGDSREDERTGDLIHKPVLLNEVLKYLDIQPGERFVDCTVGLGGHALAIVEKGGKVLGIDKKVLGSLEGVDLKQGNFADLKELVDFSPDGILLDLGMSSWQLEKSGRGFSFQKTEPLDMRMSLDNSLTAEEIVNKWSYEELAKIFYEYGGERFSRRIAARIVREREKKKIETTYDLVGLIISSYPQRKVRRIHPATKVFQALRIAVNDELENLKKVLPQALDILKPGGRLVVISFHSLEDRIVKNFFRDNLEVLTKKPIIPTAGEVKLNPRSRSAKLRAGKK